MSGGQTTGAERQREGFREVSRGHISSNEERRAESFSARSSLAISMSVERQTRRPELSLLRRTRHLLPELQILLHRFSFVVFVPLRAPSFYGADLASLNSFFRTGVSHGFWDLVLNVFIIKLKKVLRFAYRILLVVCLVPSVS